MRTWILALMLLVSLAPAASAGGLYAKIEGPDRDGVTYTARTYSCHPLDTLEPWAIAEGRIGDKRLSILIRLTPTGEKGVYRFARTWPREGRWLIRYMPGHPPAPATVAVLRANGTVESNMLYFHSDGSRECSRALRSARDDDDGC